MFLPLAFLSLTVALLVYGLVRLMPLKQEPPPRPDWLWPMDQRLEAALTEVRWRLKPWQWRTVMLLDAALAGGLAWAGYLSLPWWVSAAVGGLMPVAVLVGRVALRRRQMRRAVAAGLPLLAGLLDLRPDPAHALRAAMPHLTSPFQEEVALALKTSREQGLPLSDSLQMAALRCGDDLWLHGLAVLISRPQQNLAAGVARLALHCRKVMQLEG